MKGKPFKTSSVSLDSFPNNHGSNRELHEPQLSYVPEIVYWGMAMRFFFVNIWSALRRRKGEQHGNETFHHGTDD